VPAVPVDEPRQEELVREGSRSDTSSPLHLQTIIRHCSSHSFLRLQHRIYRSGAASDTSLNSPHSMHRLNFSPHLLPNFDPIISTVKFNLNFGSPSLERVAALRLFAINISLNTTCQATVNKATPQSHLLGNHGETAILEHQLMEVEPPTLHRFYILQLAPDTLQSSNLVPTPTKRKSSST